MPMIPDSLVDILAGIFAALCLAGVCILQWRLFAPFLRNQFWQVLFLSNAIGFFIGAFTFFVYFSVSICAYVIDPDIDFASLGVVRAGIACFGFSSLMSLMIGSLIIPRWKQDR